MEENKVEVMETVAEEKQEFAPIPVSYDDELDAYEETDSSKGSGLGLLIGGVALGVAAVTAVKWVSKKWKKKKAKSEEEELEEAFAESLEDEDEDQAVAESDFKEVPPETENKKEEPKK